MQGGLGPQARWREAGSWTEWEPGRILPRDVEMALGAALPACGPGQAGTHGAAAWPQWAGHGASGPPQSCFPAWSAGL